MNEKEKTETNAKLFIAEQFFSRNYIKNGIRRRDSREDSETEIIVYGPLRGDGTPSRAAQRRQL